MKSPTCGPEHRLHRHRLRPDDVHLDLRARSEAATSRPMKLAPITTARFAVSAAATRARLSASVRR